MKLATNVEIPRSPYSMEYGVPMLLLGSCFADEIGGKMKDTGFEVLNNPFGTLYNPYSVAACLQRTLENMPIAEDEMVFHEGLWHSWLHHSRFSHPEKRVCLEQCNDSVRQAHGFLQKSPWVWITFGTAWVFALVQGAGYNVHTTGAIVANCHKLPPSCFERYRLTVPEIVEMWKPLVEKLSGMGCRIVFTVSPIRHMADGAHGNQLSKATLLLAVDALVEMFGNVQYFDSYEILMDELRDYRFYARDMCHPSGLAVDLVWERLQQTYMSETTRICVGRNEKLHRQLRHRPLHSYND